MPKITIHFNLPEDKFEATLAQTAYNYYSTVQDFRETLRSIIKYDNTQELRNFLGATDLTDEQLIATTEALRELFNRIVNDNNAHEIE